MSADGRGFGDAEQNRSDIRSPRRMIMIQKPEDRQYSPDGNDWTGDQTFTIDGARISFAAGETVHTENSHKYAPGEFAAMAGNAGFERVELWTDDRSMFSVHLFSVTG